MLKWNDTIGGNEYITPSCRTFLINYQNVVCDSLNNGGRETFGGFTNAEDDFFDE